MEKESPNQIMQSHSSRTPDQPLCHGFLGSHLRATEQEPVLDDTPLAVRERGAHLFLPLALPTTLMQSMRVKRESKFRVACQQASDDSNSVLSLRFESNARMTEW